MGPRNPQKKGRGGAEVIEFGAWDMGVTGVWMLSVWAKDSGREVWGVGGDVWE
jgi:hypothetical protein